MIESCPAYDDFIEISSERRFELFADFVFDFLTD
jgi:hypothetical protein